MDVKKFRADKNVNVISNLNRKFEYKNINVKTYKIIRFFTRYPIYILYVIPASGNKRIPPSQHPFITFPFGWCYRLMPASYSRYTLLIIAIYFLGPYHGASAFQANELR